MSAPSRSTYSSSAEKTSRTIPHPLQDVESVFEGGNQSSQNVHNGKITRKKSLKDDNSITLKNDKSSNAFQSTMVDSQQDLSSSKKR